MVKQWYQVKEKSAGRNRLLLTWYIYKIFGKFPVDIIANAVSSITYVFASEQRQYIRNYLNTLSSYSQNRKYQYSYLGGLKIFLNFADSLVDKMLVFSEKFSPKNIRFADIETENAIMKYLKGKQGIFFITTHIGNPEIIRTLLTSNRYEKPKVNIFLEADQCKIFNGFINQISVSNIGIETYAVEDINVGTSSIIYDKLKNGEILFMAGDRISKKSNEKVVPIKFLGKDINLPVGVFRFAYMMNTPIFFISAIKENGGYKIYAQEFVHNFTDNRKEILDLMHKKYIEFLENLTINYPYQYYNFFDVFSA